MANLQAALRAFASASISPATLCRKLNEVLCNNSAADKFVTFCYCTIDAGERKLSYANAGHWPPILLRQSGTRVPFPEVGFPLGIYPDATYEDSEVQLEPGDRLVLYTDGVTEATNHGGEEFGEPRLVELCRLDAGLGAADRLQAITTKVSAFSSGNFQDDFTLVVVAVK
jgi:sigma-B regulation protein RsbU (phosphoserine phosphatase)